MCMLVWDVSGISLLVGQRRRVADTYMFWRRVVALKRVRLHGHIDVCVARLFGVAEAIVGSLLGNGAHMVRIDIVGLAVSYIDVLF